MYKDSIFNTQLRNYTYVIRWTLGLRISCTAKTKIAIAIIFSDASMN